jgi:hypothetical protein
MLHAACSVPEQAACSKKQESKNKKKNLKK